MKSSLSWEYEGAVFVFGGDLGIGTDNAELVSPDGTTQIVFDLKYPASRSSCVIDEGDTFLVTGSLYSSYNTMVSRYGPQGWIDDLAPLSLGRTDHACTRYQDSDGNLVNKIYLKRHQSYNFSYYIYKTFCRSTWLLEVPIYLVVVE